LAADSFETDAPAETAVLAPDALRRRYLRASIAFVLATAAALWVDLPVARWVDEGGFRRLGDFDSLVIWSEIYAHGVGVSVILLVVFVLDPAHRRHVLRLGVLSLGAGLVANVAKLLVTRERPYLADIGKTSFETFHGGMFPPSHQFQSFPSGHTAAAVGLAIGLSWLYPRGRWMFFTFAAIAASQRWANRDHFVSDSCGGAAIATCVAAFVLGSSAVQRWFDRFECGNDEPKPPKLQ
jgi:membrane-associated phospholipid phosphatase